MIIEWLIWLLSITWVFILVWLWFEPLPTWKQKKSTPKPYGKFVEPTFDFRMPEEYRNEKDT